MVFRVIKSDENETTFGECEVIESGMGSSKTITMHRTGESGVSVFGVSRISVTMSVSRSFHDSRVRMAALMTE